MIPSLSERAPEKGKYTITITAKTEGGVELSFADFTNPQWQLMNEVGTVITDCAFGDNAMTSLSVELKGNQLALYGPSDNGKRHFSFQAMYGADPYNYECKFNIEALLGQVNEAAI